MKRLDQLKAGDKVSYFGFDGVKRTITFKEFKKDSKGYWGTNYAKNHPPAFVMLFDFNDQIMWVPHDIFEYTGIPYMVEEVA